MVGYIDFTLDEIILAAHDTLLEAEDDSYVLHLGNYLSPHPSQEPNEMLEYVLNCYKRHLDNIASRFARQKKSDLYQKRETSSVLAATCASLAFVGSLAALGPLPVVARVIGGLATFVFAAPTLFLYDLYKSNVKKVDAIESYVREDVLPSLFAAGGEVCVILQNNKSSIEKSIQDYWNRNSPT